MSIENQLIEFVVEITDISSEELALTGSLLEYGFDSISLTELSNRINAVYTGATTPAILLEYDSLGEIAAFLQQPGSVEIVPVAEPPKGLTMADMMLNQAAPVITSGAATPVTAAPVAAEPFKDSTLVQAPIPKQTAQGVAIIGISCHYPQSPDPAAYWQTIVNNQNAITALPEARKAWCDKALFAQSDYSFASGFIDDIDLFDADYFGISAREARMMDPQQRLMLEHALKALGDAGYDKTAIAGTDTGVFVGAAASDYQNLLVKRGLINSHYSTGVDHSIIANRVSYHFDLNGPSEVINTACSSSLVALNRAKRAIECGECQTALVGGIGCIIDQHLTEGFNQAGMLSPDNRCKTFDESANGYVRGEGIGVVMLKSLAQAEIDGDRIYAALIGSASNHGGAVRSLTVPNPDAQTRVIEKALNDAGLTLTDIDYIEAHGTATKLGDPVEANGLKRAALKCSFPANSTIALGSVKANIGHLEAGAGLAGVIKVLLMMKHQTITANSALCQPNQYLQLHDSPFYLPGQNSRWQSQPNKPMRAGVSSFGFGGANAHVVLESVVQDKPKWPDKMPFALLVSGQTQADLKQQAQAAIQRFEAQPFEPELLNALVRNHQGCRLVVSGDTPQQMIRALSAFIQGETSKAIQLGNQSAASNLFNQELENLDLVAFMVEKGKWSSLLKLWCQGIELDWQEALTPGKRRALPMPVFNKQRYWFDQIEGVSAVVFVEQPQQAVMPKAAKSGLIQLTPLAQFGATVVVAQPAPEPIKPPVPQLQPPELALYSAPAPRLAPEPAPSVDTTDMANQCKRLLAEVLLMEEDEVELEVPFAELGLDSILTVEFVKALNQQLGTKLNASDLYDSFNLDKLVQKLVVRAAPAPEALSIAAPAPEPLPIATSKPAPKQLSIPKTATSPISLDALTQLLATTLCCDADEMSIDQPFSELGLDSILGVEFVKGINQQTGLKLTAEVLFEHVTLAAIHQSLGHETEDLDNLLQQVYQGEMSADEVMKRGL